MFNYAFGVDYSVVVECELSLSKLSKDGGAPSITELALRAKMKGRKGNQSIQAARKTLVYFGLRRL
jgi:hypothetical protein